MVHAAAMTSLLDQAQGRNVALPFDGRWIAALWTLLTLAAGAWALGRFKAWWLVPATIAVVPAWLALAAWLVSRGAAFSPSAPLLAYILMLFVITIELWLTQREQGQLLRSFASYVAPSVLREILRLGLDNPMLPQHREITVLAADMQDYTGLTNRSSLQDAAQLTREFLQCLTEPILACGGTLDKYTGDGLVAFWGAPIPDAGHATQALEAARAIMERTARRAGPCARASAARHRIRSCAGGRPRDALPPHLYCRGRLHQHGEQAAGSRQEPELRPACGAGGRAPCGRQRTRARDADAVAGTSTGIRTLVVSYAEKLAAGASRARGRGGRHRGALKRVRVVLAPAVLLACAVASHADEATSEQRALSASGVAGEIMDIAVEHCRRGEHAQAIAMFDAIRAQLDPPPAILQLILDLEATGCDKPPLASGAVLRVQASGGWDSNVSQGITARTLVLGSGETSIELELDPSYRPRSSTFFQVSTDYSLVLPRYGVSMQVALGQRKNFDAPDFDLRSLSSAAAKEAAFSWGVLRAQAEVTQVWLGERNYQHSEQLALQWIRQMQAGAWLGTVSATSVQYITQPLQNATLWNAGLVREWRIDASKSVNLGLSLQRDDAHGSRPGGDRRGYELQAGAVVLFGGWRLHPQLDFTSWDSAAVFAPGLLDVRRHNRLVQGSFVAERPLTGDMTLALEWRGRWARDTVALYQYRAQTVSATLAFRF
jgi:hypothetical protein